MWSVPNRPDRVASALGERSVIRNNNFIVYGRWVSLAMNMIINNKHLQLLSESHNVQAKTTTEQQQKIQSKIPNQIECGSTIRYVAIARNILPFRLIVF